MLLFTACAFPVHVWSILNVLRELPAWVLRLSSWELIGVTAYALVFALAESAIVFLGLLLVSVILPFRFFRDKLVALGSAIVFLSSGWAIVAHYNDEIIRLWGLREFSLGLLLYLASTGMLYGLVRRYERMEKLLDAFAERLMVLSFLYVFVDVLGVIVVIARNV